ncbi:NosX [Cupriavidus necator]|uniref:FAD:protein FMN transferase n=1 Tax=Cupriavidus necator TaxID=106590 RepID=A0A1K0JY47_CUPNE|nr:NosX [Cupriavidus necator]
MNASRPDRPNPGRRRLLCAWPLLATGLWIRPALADPRVAQSSRTLMGTRVDITVQARLADTAAPAMAAAWAEMARLADLLSRYRAGSQVHALQLAAGVQPVKVAPEMLRVLGMANRMSRRSAGAFDITIGAFAGWDFDPAHPAMPDQAEIARELPLVNYRDVVVDARAETAYLCRRGMRIDLGGIAKLPVLQAGMDVLRQHGLDGAMINGGGDVLVSGALHGRAWRIGVRDPLAPARLAGVIAMHDGVVAASGDYERCFMQAGRRYHHILDPGTGMPSAGPHGVTLVARGVDDINGLGAAIMVAGEAKGRHWLEALPGIDAMIVGPGGRRWLSAGMAARLIS